MVVYDTFGLACEISRMPPTKLKELFAMMPGLACYCNLSTANFSAIDWFDLIEHPIFMLSMEWQQLEHDDWAWPMFISRFNSSALYCDWETPRYYHDVVSQFTKILELIHNA